MITIFISWLKNIKHKLNDVCFVFWSIVWKLYYNKKQIIIFESVPDFADNTRYVFDEMVRRNLFTKYTFVWLAYNPNLKKSLEHSELIYDNIYSFFRRAQVEVVYKKALALIFCSRRNAPKGNKQIVFYLSHGTPIKDVSKYYILPEEVDYCLCTSPNTIELTEYSFSIQKTKIYPLGFPRNDSFFKNPIDIKRIINRPYDKIIIWYPTFRKEKAMLPLMHNKEDLDNLNNYCKSLNIIIVIKFHFHDGMKADGNTFSNILFIDDDFYKNINILPYDFLNATDALLTDYSSVYYDYLLCNRPIGVIWEDIEQYKNNPGFAVDLDAYLSAAVKIYTLEELKKYILDVKNGSDLLSEERIKISNIVNTSCDDNSSGRVVDFILQKIDDNSLK